MLRRKGALHKQRPRDGTACNIVKLPEAEGKL